MKQFFTVLSFELTNYFKTKGYVITTVLVSILLIIGLSLPSVFDMSKLIPQLGNDSAVTDKNNKEEKDSYVLVDDKNIITDMNYLNTVFTNSEWKEAKDINEAKELIDSGEVKAGFVVDSLNKYTYLVKNKGFEDSNQYIFQSVLEAINQQNYANENGLNFEELQSVIHPQIECDVTVLGKDSSNNFFYVYILIFGMYMMILLYGQLIAVAVTSEKSNRAMEILVTSANSNCLIFGKVIGAALASFIQVGVILASGIVTYTINRSAWNGILDNIFNIPSNILITFIVFGTIGYLFYAFIFGALGALVSKTEDISSSIGPVTMIFVVVFLISIFGLTNSDNLIVKIASFIPFSSSMTMLVRVAMGSVSNLEIISSFLILLVSTILIAFGAARVYRLGTLMYGNPIKLTNALKWLKPEKK